MSKEPPKIDKAKATGRTNEVRLQPAGEVVVEHQQTPPTAPPDLKIHARRRLRTVPEAKPKPGDATDQTSE